MEAVDHRQWRRGGSKWSFEWSVEQWSQIQITLKRNMIRIYIRVKSRIRIRISIKEVRGIWIQIQVRWIPFAILPERTEFFSRRPIILARTAEKS
jgi:hypothetical protein